MKKEKILPLIIISLLVSVVSAEIIINEQPKDIYNYGETISIPVKIKSLTNTYGIFQMNLICNGKEVNFYKNGISLIAGEEKEMDSSLPLIAEVLGTSTGTCKIKSSIGADYVLTKEFEVSTLIEVISNVNKREFKPEETILIEGNATKESGKEVEGFVNLTISKDGSIKIKKTETVGGGKFSIKVDVPKTMQAGEYSIVLDAYEEDLQGTTTNKGFSNHVISVSQVPTSLEISLEQKEILPGEILKIKAIILDQTGEKINSSAIISIKDGNNNILEQAEKETDEYLEYQTKEQQTPENWTIIAISNPLISESKVTIKEHEKVNISLINKTLLITNIGNVFYNKTVLVKIGEDAVNINASLKVGESRKYRLSAPNGEYQVKISSQEGEEIQETVTLTGNAISIREISQGTIGIIRHPSVWLFITIILGIVAFFLFKKVNKKKFFGYPPSEKNKPIIQPEEKISHQKGELVSSKNRANLLLSLQGTKQPSNIVCIKIKNYSEITSTKNNVKETLQKIADMSESIKASLYENNEYLFFMLIPSITKTFENELTAADFAQSAKKILDEHNRLFKQKINYGISIEYGDLIAKKTESSINIMGLGQFMINARKIASISGGEVYLGEKMKEKIQPSAKLEKHSSENISYYTIKELRDKEKNQKFLSSFVKRLERDKNQTREPQKEKAEENKKIEEDRSSKFESL